jgi:hypothetical protein
MGFLSDQQGTISVFRTSLVIGFFGALLLGAGVLSFFLDQESRRSPLEIEPPSNAVTWGNPEERREGRRYVYYQVPGGDVAAVTNYYNRKLRDHYGEPPAGQRPESCERFPRTGTFPNAAERGVIPFYVRCMFDNSGLNTLQYTQVTIQPGQFNEDPFYNTQGNVVIEYEQRWTP